MQEGIYADDMCMSDRHISNDIALYRDVRCSFSLLNSYTKIYRLSFIFSQERT